MAKQIIVLDPGHNRNVLPAKQSPDGTFQEYSWNWDMASRFKDMLEYNGYDVRMTITKEFSDDVKTKDSLTKRTAFANNLCKQYGSSNVTFVSIHCNAAGNGKWYDARGWSIFVAANKAGQITGSKASQQLANCLFDAVAEKGFTMRKPSASQKFWPGNFTVLTATNCKAVLMENFFYDNKEDVKLLQSKDTQDKLLDAWYKGLMTYLGEPTEPKKPDNNTCTCTCTCDCCKNH